jgi:acetoin utilization protein AcuB
MSTPHLARCASGVPVACSGAADATPEVMGTHTIAQHMTGSPYTIGPYAPLSAAHSSMRAHGVRHLPVVEGSHLVGMVTMRDLHLLETLKDIDPDEVQVREAMTGDPYVVSPDTALGEVVGTMLEHKVGSAVVLDHGRVAGVFTTIDALRALANLLAEPAHGWAKTRARKSTRSAGTQKGSTRTRAASAVPRAGRT